MIRALAIVGPTASGKTALSIRLAKELGCEILSMDSMQIYRGMDVGTAKATAEERAEVPHHLIDIRDPAEDYSAEDYKADALRVAKEVEARGNIPLFVGGTGLYLDTLMRAEQTPVPESDRALRDSLLAGCETDEGRQALWDRLFAVDPECAATVHKNNARRIARALEIYLTTGRKKSELDRENGMKNPDVDVAVFVLDFHSRELLYRRIDRRVDDMIANGLEAEVRALESAGIRADTTAAQAIGYKEMFGYLDGQTTLDEAVESIRQASRRYAKRQMTWFRHEKDACRICLDDEDGRLLDTETIYQALLREAKNRIEK